MATQVEQRAKQSAGEHVASSTGTVRGAAKSVARELGYHDLKPEQLDVVESL